MEALVSAGVDLCQYPAQTPPDGQTSNFVDPVSLQSAVIGVGVSMSVLSIIFTMARIRVNWRNLHAADYCAVMGTILLTAYTIITLIYSKYDRHQWDTPACWFNKEYLQFLYVQLTIFGPSVFFAKAAIFLMYLQFFGVHKKLRIAVYIGIFVTFGAYWTSVPVAAYYGAPHPGETWESLFLNERPIWEAYWGVSQGAIAIVLDIYIFLLPIPILWKLNTNRTRRIQLITLFGTALIAIAASAVALKFRLKLLTKPGETAWDTTWNQACTSIAVLIENNVAIVVGSMPAFAGFLRLHVAGSAAFKSLRSRILRVTGSSGRTGWSRGHTDRSNRRPKVEDRTFAALPQARFYHELKKVAVPGLVHTEVTSSGAEDEYSRPQDYNGEHRVWRSVEVIQESRTRSSETASLV